MIYLKQSTASQEVLLGPFVDSTDGVTAETGLTIANTDIKLHKAGATTLADKNSGGATHISGGNYYAVFDATDTNTLGSGAIIVQVSGALAVRVNFCVLAANVYDSIIGGGDLLDVSTTQFNGTAVTASGGRPEVNVTHAAGTAWGSGAITAASIANDAITDAKVASDVTIASVTGAVGSVTGNVGGNVTGSVGSVVATVNANMTQISGDTTAADNLETAFDDTAGAVPWLGIVDQGTAQAATSTTLQLRSAAAFADDQLIGATIVITGGSAGVGQSREILDYVSSTDTATVDAWTTTPSGTITYKIHAGPPAPATAPAVNLTHIAGAAVSTSTAQLGVNVVSMSANSMTAAAAASDLTTELQSGLATASALSTVAGYLDTEMAAVLAAVDTEVAAIKTVTDKLDTALELDSTVYRFTVNALEQAPSGTGASAASIRAEIDANSTQLAAILADTNDIQTRIPAALVSGRMDASVGAMAANVITAAATATDFTTEVTSGLATASALATVAGYVDTEVAAVLAAVDTEVAAIKAKTDNLPASPAATSDIPSAATIADAVWDEVVDGTTTARQSVRLANSALGGEVAGADGTTVTIRDLADSKDRLTVTVDANGNRTALTRDLT